MELVKEKQELALFYVVAISTGQAGTIKSVHLCGAKIKQFFTKPKIHLLLPLVNLYS